MEQYYYLDWLDKFITETYSTAIQSENLLLIQQQIEEGKEKFCTRFRSEVFRLTKQKKIRLLVSRYYMALLQLLHESTASIEKISKESVQLMNIYKDIIQWLEATLSFIEKRFPAYLGYEMQLRNLLTITKEVRTSGTANQRQYIHKLTCNLSSDQLGLILRAAEELKIISAKSMNEVFKTVVPYLSTAHKEELSYDGMRSKSYVAEKRDKRIAIERLEQIMIAIKEY